MSEERKKQLVVLFWLVVCVTILPPLLFGEARSVKDQVGGNSWRNFIFDFQTLIGGGAAILAAWHTVRQMRISDMKSDGRHQELVELQLRSDRLRVERMLKPGLSDLQDCYEEISLRFETLSKLHADEPAAVAEVVNQLNSKCHDAVRIMKRLHFKDASDLFDGNLAHQFDKTMARLNDLLAPSYRCIVTAQAASKTIAGGDVETISRSAQTLANILGRVVVAWEAALEPFADMNVSLKGMKKTYHIH